MRATAILAGSSAVTLFVGLLNNKVWALFGGVEGVASLGLLQAALNLTLILSTFGLGTGVVRLASASAADGHSDEVAAVFRSSWIIASIAFLVIALAALGFGSRLSPLLFGPSAPPWFTLLLVAACGVATAAAVLQAQLNAYHLVGALARVAVASSIAGLATGALLLWLWGWKVAVLSVVASSLAGALLAAVLHARRLPKVTEAARSAVVRRATKGLLSFGAPYTLAALSGYGVQLLMPALVLHRFGISGVGLYRAASTISVAYLGFLLTALAQDYYPRLARSRDASEAVAVANEQQRLVLTLSLPVILAFAVLAPQVVQVVFSTAFSGASTILEWQLIGDVLRFFSWTLSFVVLARGLIWHYVLLEVTGGISFLLAMAVGSAWLGLSGLGVGFLAAYVFYLAASVAIARLSTPYVCDRQTWGAIRVAIVAVGLYGLSRISADQSVRLAVGLAAVAVAAWSAGNFLWSNLGVGSSWRGGAAK